MKKKTKKDQNSQSRLKRPRSLKKRHQQHCYIVMECGKFLDYATFLTIILSCLHALSLCRPACSFTMQAFFFYCHGAWHNKLFCIVMDLHVASSWQVYYYATFVDNYFVMSACSFTMQTCMLFHYAGF